MQRIAQISDEISLICKDLISEYQLMNEGVEQLRAYEKEIKLAEEHLLNMNNEIRDLKRVCCLLTIEQRIENGGVKIFT